VIRDLKQRRPNAVVSVDTHKASVARAAIELGAEVVNDVSGFRWDPKMAKTLAELKVGAVLMHTRGRPEEWRSLPPIGDPVLIVKREFAAVGRGGDPEGDQARSPGTGSGVWVRETFEENYPLLAHFAELQKMGFPLLAGVSRKSFIDEHWRAMARTRKWPSGFTGRWRRKPGLILKGAHIIRTHDVRFAVDAGASGGCGGGERRIEDFPRLKRGRRRGRRWL